MIDSKVHRKAIQPYAKSTGSSCLSLKNDTYFARYKVALIKSRLLRPISRVLEYGCGIGRNIPFLREAFPEASVVGTDISRSSIEIARQYQPDVDFFIEGSDVSQLGLLYSWCISSRSN